jgi:ferredoxin
MKRKIFKIDEEKCFGCGNCVPECPQAALQIIDGKARLTNELLCDGLGECVAACSGAAISMEEREAPQYEETQVIASLAPQGMEAIRLHMRHLRKRSMTLHLQQAITCLRERGIEMEAPGSGK